MSWEKLGAGDQQDVMAYLARSAERSVILLHNAQRFGLEQGEGPFHADYFGVRDRGGLAAVGALYNLGALFFRADAPETVAGLAAQITRLGRLPAFTAGPRSHVGVLLDELRGLGPVRAEALDSVYMVLSGAARAQPGQAGARPATLDDLDTLVALQLDFEREAFGHEIVEPEAVRRMITFQIGQGGAMVVERGGRVVSKAEATVAAPHAAIVGGVYTLPELRGQGLSSACLAALGRHLLARVRAVGLNVYEHNLPARRVYEKTGFAVVEQWSTVELRAEP